MSNSKTYIVEHLDPDLESWSQLEYLTVAKETHAAGSRFFLTSVPPDFKLPAKLQGVEGLNVEHKGVEELYAGEKKASVCLLDPAAKQELGPEDGDRFEVFLFGGILGDDPPRDRTSELRAKGFEGRRLGPVQMTTDTAVRVTRMIVQGKQKLEEIGYVDFPEFKFGKNESHEMPFRYVKGSDGQPVIPDGWLELLKEDSNKGIADLL